ncbi:hypothetical protein BpHYR1_046190 [Brachionus plicatilis]|uniref:Uncharacterized protein n=1 Tax=Brachionus plicatilis TaxID=10195 RepID=A0A3M7Q490_BRAPC|nr:hypothetical protein BpHYR1_046190 [Brachionus plicatilis]
MSLGSHMNNSHFPPLIQQLQYMATNPHIWSLNSTTPGKSSENISTPKQTEETYQNSTKEQFTLLKFSGENIINFKRYNILDNELKKHPKYSLIKSAYVNQNKELVIRCLKVDAEMLTTDWPNDAFKSGIQNIKKNKRFFLALNHVDTDFDLDSIKESLLIEYGIIGYYRSRKHRECIKKWNKII